MAKNRTYNFFKVFFNPLFNFLFPVKVMGKENLPDEKRVLTVSNHLSAVDIGMIIIKTPGYKRMLAKKELGDNKMFRPIGKACGVIFIDRGAPDLDATRKVIAALKDNEGICMFPEGTRNKVDTNLQEVKAGAAMFALKGGATVVPIMIHHKQKVFKKNYVYIGHYKRLNELFGERVDTKKLETATAVITKMMLETKAVLDDIVENKRFKEVKLAKKAKKARIRETKHQAKVGLKRLGAYAKAAF